MPVPVFNLSRQAAEIGDELEKAASAVLASGQYVMGEQLRRFEAEAASHLRVRHAIGVASGTDALLLSLEALGIGPGDEVITTDWSFFATAEVILRLGAVPVLVAPDPATFNLDVGLLEQALSARTKAIVPVHLYGQTADMDGVNAFARAHGLRVVEDACQAFGAEWRGMRAGALSDAGCFSFYPTKNLGGVGDGGLVTTNDDDVADAVRSLSLHGQGPGGKYVHERLGHTSRLDELQAALLRVKLRHVDAWTARRQAIAARYSADVGRSGADIVVPSVAQGATHVYHQYVVRTKDRDSLRAFLKAREIGSEVYYPLPLHAQPATVGRVRALRPEVSLALAAEVLALPMFPELTDGELAEVGAAVADWAAGRPA